MLSHFLAGGFLEDSDDYDREEDGGGGGGGGGIRRACSLSDLNNVSTPTPIAANTTSSSTGRRKRSFHRHRNGV